MTPADIRLVMLVDDSPTDRFIHKKLLEIYKIGEGVVEVNSAREGLNYLNKYKDDAVKLPDVILLDVLMPEMNGFDFLTSLRNLHGKLVKKPVIYMLSSTDDETDLRRARRIKLVEKLLRKPFSPETLVKALSEL